MESKKFICYLFSSRFNNSSLEALGRASYFTYLIHEPIGLLVLQKIYNQHFAGVITLILIIILVLLILGFSHLYTIFVEKKIHIFLMKILNL